MAPKDQDAKAFEKMTLGELKQGKFRMRVNNKTYDVYPDLTSIVRDPVDAAKHKDELKKFDAIENSIPIARQTILRDYYSSFMQALKKEAGSTNKVS